MTKNNNQKKILILGCGLSGMITALALASYGVPSVIVESRSATSESFFKDSRTTALTATSKNFFEKIGLWRSLQEICGDINDIYVVYQQDPNMIHFTANTGKERMGYLVENADFKKCLYELVKQNKLISVIEEAKYQPITFAGDRAEVKLDNGQKITADLVIICEGRKSRLAAQFINKSVIRDYEQHAITFNVYHEKDHEGTAVEHFAATGPFAILPLRYPNKSSIVWTVPNDYAALLKKLPLSELNYLVQQNFGLFLGKTTIENHEIVSFPLSAFVTERYYYKNLVVVADAAHVIHPLAGQGLNQGIKDIECLTSLLISSQARPVDILPVYEKSRRGDNKAMFLLTDNINGIFASDFKIFKKTIPVAFHFIEKFPLLKGAIVSYAKGGRLAAARGKMLDGLNFLRRIAE